MAIELEGQSLKCLGSSPIIAHISSGHPKVHFFLPRRPAAGQSSSQQRPPPVRLVSLLPLPSSAPLQGHGRGKSRHNNKRRRDLNHHHLSPAGDDWASGGALRVFVELFAGDDHPPDCLNKMKQHREEDALRGHAVKNQKAIWDKTLEMRFLLQKAFSTSNKLPQEPIKTRFCDHDKEIKQAYDDLLNSSKQTLGSMMELQEALIESNQAGNSANEMPSASNGDNDEWSEIQRLQTRITTFRNSEIDKWQRKIQVTTGAAALKGKLHVFNQDISDQVAGYMRDPSRMLNRMYLTKSAVGVFGQDEGEPGTAEGHNMEGDPELVDDSEFYQQLLKEFLESCDRRASESAFYALRKQQVKKRKLVDRRASKSRKIRYHVHEKITNFMAPVPMVLPSIAPMLFENLFGTGN